MLKMCEESLRLYVEGVERRVGRDKLRLFSDLWVGDWDVFWMGETLKAEWEDGATVEETARAIEGSLNRLMN